MTVQIVVRMVSWKKDFRENEVIVRKLSKASLYGLSIATLQLLIGCGQAAEESEVASEIVVTEEKAPATKADENRAPETAQTFVVAFGDSLYAGYGLARNEGFAPELENALKAAGVDGVSVKNAGVSGDTTAAGLRRLEFVLDSLTEKPDLVLLGLGGNDVLRGLKPADTRKNLEAMLDILRAREIPVLLTGMIAPVNLGGDYSREFNRIYPDLSAKYGTALYPFFLNGLVGRNDLLLPDGIHPNEKGIDLIVGKVAPEVQKALES